MDFIILMIIALVVSCIGFKKFVYFISLGYGFSVAVMGVALVVMFWDKMSVVSVVACALLVVYGCRLGGFLLKRELKSASYQKHMRNEVNDGSTMPFFVKVLIWVSCAFLYACEVSPILFRFTNGGTWDVVGIVGICIMLCGIVLESASDLQKSALKKVNPNRFCDTGLFSIVRCPNYLGEVLTWTGVFVSGVTVLAGPVQWILAIIGYVCIVYIMFGGARRLEIRQNRNYGADPEYQKYVKTTPILIPLIPLYSVEKYEWLKG